MFQFRHKTLAESFLSTWKPEFALLELTGTFPLLKPTAGHVLKVRLPVRCKTRDRCASYHMSTEYLSLNLSYLGGELLSNGARENKPILGYICSSVVQSARYFFWLNSVVHDEFRAPSTWLSWACYIFNESEYTLPLPIITRRVPTLYT